MDPLSITASIIAIIGVGGQAAKATRRLGFLKGAPDLILALNNEIADLHLVVVAIQDVFERQQTSGMPVPGNRAKEFNLDASVTNSLTQAKDKVMELEALYKRLDVSILASNTEFNKVTWLREYKRVKQLQEDLRNIRLKLAGALGILNSSALIRLETGVHGLRTQLSNLYTNQQQDRTVQDQRAVQQDTFQQSLHSETEYLLSLHQNSKTVQDQTLSQQGDIIREPITRFTTAPQRFEVELENAAAALTARTAESEARATMQSSAHAWAPPAHNFQSSGIQISTSISHWQCEDSCACICHRRYAWKTPRLWNQLLGLLFIGYTGIPYISPGCNTRGCTQRSSPMTLITYMFPSWLLARILLLTVKFSSINGLELNLRVPRIVSKSSAIFDLCEKGDVEGVKGLFRQGLASPLDSSHEFGVTPLMFAVQYGHVELIELLLHAGGDPYFENLAGRNASENAWVEILSGQYDAQFCARLRTLFPGEEFIEEQEFSLLHKAVLGLNPLPLEILLASMTKSMIDARDARGRTALWWTAKRADYTTMYSLIKAGADVNIKSASGWTPLATAIVAQNGSCIKLLLEHNSRVDERNIQGWLPLHMCSYWGCDLEVLELILIRTADINTTSSMLKDTALMLAAQEDQLGICEFLISNSAGINLVNEDGLSALYQAIRLKSNKSLRLLLQNQADTSLKTHAGETLLHYAAQFGNLECLKILHAFDLKGINTADKVTRSSPFHKLKNLKGLTALQIAEQRRNESSEWIAMFRKLICGVGFPETKALLSSFPGEVEKFEDALENQH